MFERDSALQLQRSLGQLINQLPPRPEAERLANIYFEVRPGSCLVLIDKDIAWGTAILDRKVFTVDVFERFYGDAGGPDVQRLAVLYLTLALGSLFDPLALPGAISESITYSNADEDNVYSRDLFALGRACLSMDATASIICEL